MNSITLSEHSCADKCTEFKNKGEQCSHCLIQHVEKQEFELGIATDAAYVKAAANLTQLALLSAVGGINQALTILKDNPDDFAWYSLEKNYYYNIKAHEDLICLDDLKDACRNHFIELFGGILAIQYILDEAPKEATHFERFYEKVDFKEKTVSLWVDGSWAEQSISLADFNRVMASSVALGDLEDALDGYKPVIITTFDDTGTQTFSYLEITQATIAQIEFFNTQKYIANQAGEQQEADTFDNQADGAYLLWFSLTKDCRTKFDNERLQELVGAKA
ncbi:hypothetical protein [Acinetobacter sp. TUM15113]|uniref:hypothetical protein n=1 Tax=Acinetobacter sp. TUM15113 TaxID=2609140 RepID=UPI00124F27D4|nr:hypothetical protein [Acinetobacter sp. TUM15113]